MNDQRTAESAVSAMLAAWKNLIDTQVALGSQLVQSMTGVALPTTGDFMRTIQARTTHKCCEIPPPCWMPQPLGDCTSHVGQCKTACIRLVITNRDRVARTITAESSDKTIKITPASLSLDPFARGTVSACIDIPQDAANGTQVQTVISLHGCRDYYLRWTVSVGTLGIDACHEIDVEDGPDLVHHWYDHFYCVRGCMTRTQTGTHG